MQTGQSSADKLIFCIVLALWGSAVCQRPLQWEATLKTLKKTLFNPILRIFNGLVSLNLYQFIEPDGVHFRISTEKKTGRLEWDHQLHTNTQVQFTTQAPPDLWKQKGEIKKIVVIVLYLPHFFHHYFRYVSIIQIEKPNINSKIHILRVCDCTAKLFSQHISKCPIWERLSWSKLTVRFKELE